MTKKTNSVALKPKELRAYLIHNLQIVDENIRAEAIKQPMLFLEASRYRVGKMRTHSKAKATLEAYMSGQTLRVRATLQQGTKERITNGVIEAAIQQKSEYRALLHAVNEAEAREEFSKLLLEAYRMRRDAVKILADAEGYEASKQTVDLERENLNRRLSNRARKYYDRVSE